MQRLDAKIGQALNIALPDLVMPPLPPIEGAQVLHFPRPGAGRFSTRAWIGVAASVLLAVSLAVRFYDTDVKSTASLADEIVAHLDHEPQALRVTSRPVSAQRLAAVLKDDVAELDDDIGLITYANTCVIDGKEIPHLVVQGKRGPITLLLLPDELVDRALPLEGDGVSGVVLPVGRGSIAIIGEREEPLRGISQRVANAVKWTS